ncbi:hypothetical protein BH10BDE1_BH10BDE1_36670 [soil metagenome]
MSESFSQTQNANKVDILIIDDNSESMETKQRKMGERFPNFISGIKDLDYQIGITTTDLSGPAPLGSGWATDGRLVNFKGSKTNILTPTTVNADKLFLDTIKRDETIDCGSRTKFPYCPSSIEQPLKAMIMAIDERDKANTGFFRDGADLAIVVLSDEDEMSDGSSRSATKVYEVTDAFKVAFADRKRVMVHGIIIKPGDKTCLAAQRKASGIGYYGQHVSDLATATGGRTYTICDTDYGKNLTSISNDVRKLVSSFLLAFEPADPTKVEVTTSPASKIPWHIEGRLVVFDSPPADGTRIEVRYLPK